MSGADSKKAEAVRFSRIVAALGIAQIISWGSLYYSIAVLASPIQNSLGISRTLLFGAFTVGMLVSGAASPMLGRLVDERGGRHVLTAGSLVGAFAFLALALAQNSATFVFGWALGGVAMAATLYDPAFATLHQLSREHYRRTVTALTLIAGFSSTVFWPLTAWLEGGVGWRATFGIFALLHLLVCLPLHWFVVPSMKGMARSKTTEFSAGSENSTQSASYYWLATAFSMAMFVMAVVFAHLIEMLKARGTAPAEMFGQQQIGTLLGRLARPAFIAKAVAPVMFAALVAHGVSAGWAEVGLAIVAVLGFLSFVIAVRSAKP